MISKLPKTWDKLHHKPQVTTVSKQPKETQTEQTPKLSVSANYTQYNTYRPGTVSYKSIMKVRNTILYSGKST